MTKTWKKITFMQLVSVDATMFSKKNVFLPTKSWKNLLQKLLIIGPKTFFSCTGPAAQTSPELIFHVINMSQDASALLSVVVADEIE